MEWKEALRAALWGTELAEAAWAGADPKCKGADSHVSTASGCHDGAGDQRVTGTIGSTNRHLDAASAPYGTYASRLFEQHKILAAKSRWPARRLTSFAPESPPSAERLACTAWALASQRAATATSPPAPPPVVSPEASTDLVMPINRLHPPPDTHLPTNSTLDGEKSYRGHRRQGPPSSSRSPPRPCRFVTRQRGESGIDRRRHPLGSTSCICCRLAPGQTVLPL
ncbi:hypothetical protein RJ55_06778 [Drechmeria coniospora]|nr:hypothetical protein RJ55_06778 [Drechmeria coniospora]